MEKIFYADKSRFPSSVEALQAIFAEHFSIRNAVIARTENGKPYLERPTRPLHFSVTHTRKLLFVAVCDQNVGIDAEPCERVVDYPLLVKRFPQEERTEISCGEDFLRHWTVKESAVKWLGETLARSLNKLRYVKNHLFYEELELPVFLTTLQIEGHFLSICSERDFSTVTIIKV